MNGDDALGTLADRTRASDTRADDDATVPSLLERVMHINCGAHWEAVAGVGELGSNRGVMCRWSGRSGSKWKIGARRSREWRVGRRGEFGRCRSVTEERELKLRLYGRRCDGGRKSERRRAGGRRVA